MQERKRKVGRNEPCPCGSGKKYKKCHGMRLHTKVQSVLKQLNDDPEIQKELEEMKAAEMQRIKQQGKGRPIISIMHKGYRFVAVGNRFYRDKRWQTVHDFLFDYLKIILGGEWGNSELRKPYENRHPIIQWYDLVCKEQRKHIKKDGTVCYIFFICQSHFFDFS